MLLLLCLMISDGVHGGAPVFNEVPKNVTVGPGTNLEMKCVASGSPKPQVMIVKDMYSSAPLKTINETSTDVRTIATYSMLDNMQIRDSGIYACVAANIHGSIKKSFQIVVKDLCKDVTCPDNKECIPDYDTLTTFCGCPRCSTYLDPVCGSNCRKYTNQCMFRADNCQHDTNYTVVSNWICEGQQKIPIIRQQPRDTITREGSPFRIICKVSGTYVDVEWYKDGVKLAGATSELLHVTVSKVEHAGVYHCVVSNCDGIYSVQSNYANLIVIKESTVEFGPSCSVFGGTHIITFDKFTYSFQGSCTYAISVDCKLGDWYVYGTFYPCQEDSPSTCLRDVTIVHGRDYVSLSKDRVVAINGYYKKLIHNKIYDINGLKLRPDNETNLLEVTLKGEIRLLWDGIQGISIIVPNGETQVCGLCSNNDGKVDNENVGYYFDNNKAFMNMVEFANQYKVDPACGNPSFIEDQCSTDIPNDECDKVFENPVFIKGCRSVNDIRLFFKHQCYLDTCRVSVQGQEKDIPCQLGKSFSTWCYLHKGNPESWSLFTACAYKK